MSNTGISCVGWSSIWTVSSISRGSIGGSGDYSNIVGMSGSNGVMDGESSSDLSDSVSISIRVSFCLSLTLAVVSGISVSKTGVSVDSRGSNNTGVSIGSGSSTNLVGISKMSNTSISKMSNPGVSNTSYNTTVGESSCDLANSVG